MTQKEQVLNYLREHGSITSQEAWKKYDITRLADVVFRLKKDGYDITTFEKRTRKGKRYAQYVLMTGMTEQCPHCGAIYDLAQITERDSEWDGKEHVVHWHYCPCCEEPIDDKCTEYVEEDDEDEEGDCISQLNEDVWSEYVNAEARYLNR